MGKKITTIMLALLTGLVNPVSTMAEEKMQPQPTSAPEQTEAPTDLDGGISNGYPTPAPDETADGTVATPDASPDTVTDEIGENADGNTEENENQPNIEDFESLVKASFVSGVEQNEDGSFVWNVNSEEESHTFAYRLELNKLDQTQVKVLVPSTVFRDGEEGDFIASDLESDSSKLHLKVYEIQTAEDGTETKLEVKNEPRKEDPADGVSAIAEANQEVQGTPLPDTSVIGEEQKYSEHYKSQLSEESGVLEISSINEAVLNNSVLQIEYTVENEIYGNVTPQVFTAVLNILDNGKTAIEQCESNELEFVKKGGRKELKKDNVETVDKDDNASPLANTPAYAILYGNGELVFQRGSTPDASKGKVVKTYTGFETETYTYKTVPWYGNRASIKAVSFKDVIKPISTAYWFGSCSKVTAIDCTNLDTSAVTNMFAMFSGCTALTSLDLSSFNTSAVTSMYSMFNNCSSLTNLNVSSFDTSAVTDMIQMFNDCKALTSLDLSSFNTSAVKYMDSMFRNCSSLTSLDLSSFNTSAVTNMNGMFYECRSLISLNVSSFNTSAVTRMDSMFRNCSSLTNLDVSSFNTSAVTRMDGMFYLCTALETLTLGTKFSFKGDTKLVDTTWRGINTGKEYTTSVLTSTYDGSTMADTYAKPKPAYAILYESGELVFQRGRTPDASKGKALKTYTGFETKTYTFINRPPWYENRASIKVVSFKDAIKPVSTAYWFDPCPKVTAIDCTNLDTSTVTNMGSMFAGCTALETLTLGTKFSFKGDTKLVDATWRGINTNKEYTTSVLTSTYDGSIMADTYRKYIDIKFDALGGKSSESTKPGYIGMAFNSLPTAEKGGYDFVGWFTEKQGGTQLLVNRPITQSTYYAHWKVSQYTITYSLNGGSISGQKTTYNVETANFTLPIPTKTGYTFTGWTGTGLSSQTKSVTIPKGSTGNRSYTANWMINYYGVWFYNQDGKDTQSENHEYGTVLNSIMYFNRIPWSVPTGYKFKGWFTAPTGGTQYTGEEKLTKDVSLYAQYTPIAYTITYNLNGGSISGQKASYNIETANFTLPTPSKTGYTFTGWTGTGLSSPTKSVTVTKGSTGNRSYIANWSVNSYDFDLNGWLDGVSSGGLGDYGTADVYINGTLVANDASDYCTKHPYGTKYEIKDIKATVGHIYNGVHSGSLSGTVGTSGAKVFLDFSTKKTTVNFFRNFSSSDTTKSSEVYTYGKANQAFSNKGYSRSGYTLLGWAHSQTATSAEYSVNCGVVDSWIDGKYPSTNLYAVWKKDTYSISYNLNGGSVSGNPTSYQVDTADITLKNPSKTGYSFAGWTGSNGTTTQTTVKIAKGSTGNKSYTANWAANTYTYNIKYVSKSGVALGTATVSGTFGSSKNATAPAKIGYSTPVAQKVTFDSVSAKTITFTYTPVNYTITYDVNGGNSLSGERTTYTVESSAYTLPTPSRAGHTFTGWTGSNGTTAQTSVVLAKGATGNKSYKANWKANTYTVTYNANGGSGNMSKDTVTYGTSFTAKANGFTRPGYKFAGWTENADGTGSNWTNWIGKPWTWTYTRSITLYAQWTPNKLTINYHNDGAQKWAQYPDETVIDVTNKDVVKVETVNYDSIYDHASTGLLNANRFTKIGYHTVEAWKVGSKTSTTKVSDRNGTIEGSTGQSVTKYLGQDLSKGNVTVDLYPVFVANTYTNYIRHWAYGFENKEGNNNDKMAYHLKDTTFTKKYGEKVTYTTDDATSIPNGFSLRSNFGSSAYEESWKYYKMGTSFTQPAKATTAEYDYVPTTYTITYNLNGGTLSKENPSTYNVLYGVDFTNEPVRSGYKFLGWYINGKKVTGINVGCNATFSSADDLYAKLATRTTGNQTVEAKWEKLKDLTITNTVSGNMGSKDKDFTYTAQFPSSFANTTLKVQKNDDGVTTITVDTNGKCTFTLKHGESFTFKELTEAQYNAIKNLSNYGISETDYSKEGYKTTFKLKTDANGNLQILFSNQNGTILPTGIEAWGTGAVIAIIGALMLVAYWLVHKH